MYSIESYFLEFFKDQLIITMTIDLRFGRADAAGSRDIH